MKTAIPQTEQAARRWLAFYRDCCRNGDAEPCEHGHFECSTRDGGPCMDEVLCSFPALADE